MQDENDKLQEGTLPTDPAEGAVPMQDPDTQPSTDEKPKISSLADFVEPTRDLIRDRKSGKLQPIATPWKPLNAHLYGGLWPGLHILIAPPKAGKTQFALQLALNAVSKGNLAYYIGLELTPEEVVARVYSLSTNGLIHWAKMLYGQPGPDYSNEILNPEDQAVFRPTVERFQYIHETAYGWDFNQLREVARDAREKSGDRPFLVVIDYLQLLQSPDGERWEMRERIGRAAYLGRQIARDYRGTVLAISSTARTGYDNQHLNNGKARDPREFMGSGKESGEIEYAADTVQVLVRDGDGYKFALAGGRACVPAWFNASFEGGYKWDIGNEQKRGKQI